MSEDNTFEKVRRRKKRLHQNRSYIQNKQIGKNLHQSLDNQVNLITGDKKGADEINKELAMGNSKSLFSGRYLRSCGVGERKKPTKEEGFEEVEPGKWRKKY